MEKIKEVKEDSCFHDDDSNICVDHVGINIDNVHETVEIKCDVNEGDDNDQYGLLIDPDQIQIKADAEELNRRIESFILRKREHVNMVNMQEFCTYRSATRIKRVYHSKYYNIQSFYMNFQIFKLAVKMTVMTGLVSVLE